MKEYRSIRSIQGPLIRVDGVKMTSLILSCSGHCFIDNAFAEVDI